MKIQIFRRLGDPGIGGNGPQKLRRGDDAAVTGVLYIIPVAIQRIEIADGVAELSYGVFGRHPARHPVGAHLITGFRVGSVNRHRPRLSDFQFRFNFSDDSFPDIFIRLGPLYFFLSQISLHEWYLSFCDGLF